jgi:transcriptional regulator with XRE-family HTH domain
MARYGRSPRDVVDALAARARGLRLTQNLTQQQLAARAGIGLRTVKRFEQTGHATLDSVVRIALALRAEAPFDALFEGPEYASLDEALAAPTDTPRQRARRTRASSRSGT